MYPFTDRQINIFEKKRFVDLIFEDKRIFYDRKRVLMLDERA